MTPASGVFLAIRQEPGQLVLGRRGRGPAPGDRQRRGRVRDAAPPPAGPRRGPGPRQTSRYGCRPRRWCRPRRPGSRARAPPPCVQARGRRRAGTRQGRSAPALPRAAATAVRGAGAGPAGILPGAVRLPRDRACAAASRVVTPGQQGGLPGVAGEPVGPPQHPVQRAGRDEPASGPGSKKTRFASSSRPSQSRMRGPVAGVRQPVPGQVDGVAAAPPAQRAGHRRSAWPRRRGWSGTCARPRRRPLPPRIRCRGPASAAAAPRPRRPPARPGPAWRTARCRTRPRSRPAAPAPRRPPSR